ncbi:hypothetical protein GC207_03870 [bacterium]|nr:hypothetical protein [bacterium]
MERHVQRTLVLNLVVLLAGGLACFWAAGHTGSLAAQTARWYFLVAFVISLVSWFQQRLHDREKLEKLEFDELTRTKGASSLFSADDAGSFPARQSRQQFEKWFVPIFALLLVIGQGVIVWKQWTSIGSAPKVLEQSLVGMGLYAAVFLALTIFGLYASRLAQHGNHGLLRPAAGHVLLNAYICGAVAAAIFGVEIGKFKSLDFYLARLLVVVLGLITVEMALTLVFEIYRPRVRGKGSQHALYESRIVGLLSRPDSLFTTAAHALDYQFGFKVSDTWFYQFLQRSITWIILLQAGLLWLSTTVVFIDPGEQGLREVFGKSVGNVLGPGAHFKLPWPLSEIYKYRTSQVQDFVVGVVPNDPLPTDEYTTEVVQWSVSHNKEEYNMLVASRELSGNQSTNEEAAVPVNLLTVSIPVQYEIKDLKKWAYNHSDPDKLLRDIAYHEVVRYLVNVDLLEIMGEGRARAIAELKSRMQAAADSPEIDLGVNILFVGLQDTHPPREVAKAFQDVVGALQVKETKILDGEAKRAFTLTMATADASNLVTQAYAYEARTTNSAAGQADQFEQQLLAYRKAPDIYDERAYLDMFSRSATNARIYLMAITNSDQVIQYDLEDKVRRDIQDIMLNSKR